MSSDNMQQYEEKNTVKNKKILKSKVRFQKPLPTYVVAFAFQETYDEPPTGRQKLCNKRSLSEVISSITPTASHKMVALDSKSVQKLAQKSDIFQRYNEIKIDIIEDHDKESGDVKINPPQTTVYIADNNIAEDSFDIQPKILFDSTKNKSIIATKRFKKSNHTVKIRNMNFKTKNSNIKKKIEQCYLTGKHSAASAQIKKKLCAVAISKLLSRTGFLKNAQATENLLETAGLNRDGNELDYNGNENAFSYSDSTSKFLSTNSSSHKTLTRNSSGTATRSDEDFFNIDTDSVVNLELTPGVKSPYKSDIINVAVAYNTAKSTTEKRCAEKDKFVLGNLTSTDTLTTMKGPLTSKASLDGSKAKENSQILNMSQHFSEVTLQGKKNISGETIIYDQFFIAKTSSDFQKSSFDSYTESGSASYIPFVCEKNEFPPQIVDSDSVRTNSVHSNRNSIIDTVIKLGIYPELIPSTSSAGEFKDSFENHFIVTDKQPSLFVTDKKASLPQTNTKTFERIKKSRNIFKKYHHNNLKNMSAHKNLSLPNNTTIKAMIDNTNLRKTNFEETISAPMPELWDRLTLILDTAMKRLEQTLAEKIIKEIKSKSFSDSQPIPQVNKVQNHVLTANKSLDIKLSVLKASEDKEVLVRQESITIIDGDKNFQCDLIDSRVIDQLMLRLSFEHPRALVSRVSPLKILKAPSRSDILREPQILKKCFELLNPPSSETQTLEDIKAAEISATATLMSSNTAGRLRTLSSRFKGALGTPTVFIKENALVITTVPVFFLGLFTLYCLIALATKL